MWYFRLPDLQLSGSSVNTRDDECLIRCIYYEVRGFIIVTTLVASFIPFGRSSFQLRLVDAFLRVN
jgi:hypothetical protein